MSGVWIRIEKINPYKDLIIFARYAEQKLVLFRKNYTLGNITPLLSLIRSMTMVMAFDYYLSIIISEMVAAPQGKNQQEMIQLCNQKLSMIQQVKEEQALLIIQGKLRQNDRIENIQLVVTKLAHQLLLINEDFVEEEIIFRRFNFIFYGVNISSKCYHIILAKVAIKGLQPQKKKFCKKETIIGEKQNKNKEKQEFQQIFWSSGPQNLKDNEPRRVGIKTVNGHLNIKEKGNTKILKLIQRVEKTIIEQSEKLKIFQQPKLTRSKSLQQKLCPIIQKQKIGRINFSKVKFKKSIEQSDQSISISSHTNTNPSLNNLRSRLRIQNVFKAWLPNIDIQR